MRLAAYAVRAGALAIALGIGAATGGVGVASADTGTVNWWNDKKGQGYITPDKAGEDVFVQRNDVIKGHVGSELLWAGDKVAYAVGYGYKAKGNKGKIEKRTALNVRPVGYGPV